MVQSKATSVSAYLKELDPERRKMISTVRKMLKQHLQNGFKEIMDFGMITYVVPLAQYPKTYNKKPLMYAALASQKNYCSLYLMNVYSGSTYLKKLESGYKKNNKKLKMGKCCIRFKDLEEIDLETVASVVSMCSVDEWIAVYEKARS